MFMAPAVIIAEAHNNTYNLVKRLNDFWLDNSQKPWGR